MKGNIEKLAVLVIITVIAPFMMAGIASAWPPAWPPAWAPGHQVAIRGQYAYTGETTCLFSPSDFNANLQPNAGWGVIQTNSREGDFTFERNGTGSADIFSRVVGLPYTIPSPPAPVPTPVPPSAGTQHITFDFTYTLQKDGTITMIVDPGTFISTQLTGPDTGRIFSVEGVSSYGVIAPDGKSIILNSGAPDKYTITRIDVQGQPLNYSICHGSGVLIWQHD